MEKHCFLKPATLICIFGLSELCSLDVLHGWRRGLQGSWGEALYGWDEVSDSEVPRGLEGAVPLVSLYPSRKLWWREMIETACLGSLAWRKDKQCLGIQWHHLNGKPGNKGSWGLDRSLAFLQLVKGARERRWWERWLQMSHEALEQWQDEKGAMISKDIQGRKKDLKWSKFLEEGTCGMRKREIKGWFFSPPLCYLVKEKGRETEGPGSVLGYRKHSSLHITWPIRAQIVLSAFLVGFLDF